MNLITVTDLAKRFKSERHIIDQFIKADLLRVSRRIKNKRFLEKTASEATLRKILRLQKKGFPVWMINRVISKQSCCAGD